MVHAERCSWISDRTEGVSRRWVRLSSPGRSKRELRRVSEWMRVKIVKRSVVEGWGLGEVVVRREARVGE